MTLRHMKIFVAVCECGSITKAAGQLYLAQPAVSLAVSELERYYGIRLFDRISRKLYLTQAGKQFLSYARHITALFDEMETGIRDWDSIGTLRIGSSITIGTYLLPDYVRQFSDLYPNIRVTVRIDNSELIENRVLNNELDFALIEGLVHHGEILGEPFLEDELVLVCGSEHPLSKQKQISPEELCAQKFLLREKGSGTRELVDSALMTHGLSVTPLWESISTRAILNGVAACIGISILPLRLVRDELEAGKVLRLALPELDLKRKLFLIHHKNKYLTGSALAFMQLCRETAAQSGP